MTPPPPEPAASAGERGQRETNGEKTMSDNMHQTDVQQIAAVGSELDGCEIGIYPLDGDAPDNLPIRIVLDLDGTGRTGEGYFTIEDAEQIAAGLTEAVRRVREVQAGLAPGDAEAPR